jgi:transcriptional regulator with XRE-family HTH domain
MERKPAMLINYERIGARIKSLRVERQLTQDQLGEMTHSSTAQISAIERGVKAPSLDTLITIANTLGASADDLVIDSLSHPSSAVGNDIQEILLDCNHDEKEMLIRTLKFLKALFSEFGV